MARISIEDCLENIENRFALVTIASHRTRQLMNGKTPFLKTKNKEAVTALREIAEGFIEGQQGYSRQNAARGPVGLSGTAGTSPAAASPVTADASPALETISPEPLAQTEAQPEAAVELGQPAEAAPAPAPAVAAAVETETPAPVAEAPVADAQSAEAQKAEAPVADAPELAEAEPKKAEAES